MIRVNTICTATLLGAAIALCADAAFAGEINLRRAVRLADDAKTIRLKDIAEVKGDDAEPFADAVIRELDDRSKAVEITVRQVRQALSETDIHWGKVHLSGRSVVVRPPRDSAAEPPVAMQPISVSGQSDNSGSDGERPSRRDRTTLAASDLAGQHTLAGEIARLVVEQLDRSPKNVRLVVNDRDLELLERSAKEQRFELRPMSNIRADRVEMAVRIWQDGRAVDQHSLTFRPQVRVDALTARRDIRRREPVGEIDVNQQSQWLSPIQADRVINADEAFGKIAQENIDEGDLLRAENLRGPTIVERGDRVIVRCLVGSTVISVEAEAREDGAMGESIEFRKVGERDTFSAEIVAAGEAVKDLKR